MMMQLGLSAGTAKNQVDRSFKPLLAARMLLRECETFFFGTASKIPSHKAPSESARLDEEEEDAVGADAGVGDAVASAGVR